jgi:hypothetical protein
MGAARVYRFDTPYNHEDLADMVFEQTSQDMYTASLDKPVQKVTRADHTDWTWEEVTFGPTVVAPSGGAAAYFHATGSTPSDPGYSATTYLYKLTSIDEDLGQESRASASFSVSNDLSLDGNYNTITWTTPAPGDRVAVYKENNGVYGYIGATEGTSFRDQNILEDLTNTPPKGQNPFNAEGDYPSTLAFHEQRLFFGRTRNRPNAVWATQTSDFENMDYSSPAKGDDALSFAIVGRRVNAINNLVSSTSLLALTSDSIVAVSGGTDSAIGPDGHILPKKQTGYRGSTRMLALDIDDVVFFEPKRGKGVRALGYTFEFDGFRSDDISLFSSHFFEDDEILRWAFQSDPYSCLWVVMTSGKMLCFTWEREQEVWGWTEIVTDGLYEDVTVVDENGESRVYTIVRRTVGGVEKRFYERMSLSPQSGDNLLTVCPLDCAIFQTYEVAQTEITGLSHLEGAAVRAYADGFEYRDLTVVGGKVTLPVAAYQVFVGLPFECSITTLPLPLQTAKGSLHTNRQTGVSMAVRTLNSRGVEVRISGTEEWEPMAERDGQTDPAEIPSKGVRDYQLPLPSHWTDGTTYDIRQEKSMPAHILALFPEPDIAEK